MNLSESQILERVKNPIGKDLVNQSKIYQSRLRVFTEALNAKELDQEEGWQEYRQHIGDCFDSKRAKRLMQYTTFPLSVVNMTSDIVSDLCKVFDARNANFSVNYPSDSVKNSFEPLLADVNIPEFVEAKGRDALKCKPNTIAVVDKHDNGKPYLIEVGEDKLRGIEFTPTGDIKCIIFTHSVGQDEIGPYTRIAHYCDEFYTVVLERDEMQVVERQVPHNVGYCPAKFLLDKEAHSNEEFNRFSFLYPLIGSLTEWQKFRTALSFAEHFEVFNVIQTPHSECAVEGCESGYVRHPEIKHEKTGDLLRASYTERCPACEDRSLIGPGTVVSVELDEDGKADSRDVFKFISPDTSGLKHVAEKLADLENYIKVNTVGYNNVLSKEAVNAVQIKGLMESKKKPLLAIRELLNEFTKWAIKTVSLSIYGPNNITPSVDWGTEWYIMGEQEVIELFNSASDAGMPDSLLKDLYYLLIETKYKTQPEKAQRHRLIAELDPYPFDNMTMLKDKYALGMVDATELKLKGNMERLLAKFERENGDLVQYGQETDMQHSTKIEFILNELKSYLENESEPIIRSSEGAIPEG